MAATCQTPPQTTELRSPQIGPKPSGRNRLWNPRRMAGVLMVLLALGVAGRYIQRAYKTIVVGREIPIPIATVRRGDINLAVTARGELRGGSPEALTAPLTGGGDIHLTLLRRSGEEVKAGEVVAQFDTTEQEYKLKEAEADLAESIQHMAQVKAQGEAEKEEDRYELLKAKADVAVAELDVRKNPLLSTISAKQNDLALDAARDHLAQLQQNLANRTATSEAAIAMQEAGRSKAESQAQTAKRNIEAMVLRAHRPGYVAIKQNTSGNFFISGMTLPFYQVGDTVQPGMAVAEIPDLKNWEVGANIGELDRGHLKAGDKAAIHIVAVPGQAFFGRLKELGSTNGPPWNRRFECKFSLDNPLPSLRPGMSATITVTTDEMHQVLWLPAQALFEADGRTFVYVRSGSTFVPKDAKLIRRNETRVVIDGLTQGQVVALADPTDLAKKKATGGGAMQSIKK